MAVSNEGRSFADLPFELREKIYRLSLVWDGPLDVLPKSAVLASMGKQPLSLLKTCKRINTEAASIFYRENHFTFRSLDLSGALQFLQNIGHVNASHVRQMGIAPLSLSCNDPRDRRSDARELNSRAPGLKIFEIFFADIELDLCDCVAATFAKQLLESAPKLEKVFQAEDEIDEVSEQLIWKFVTNEYTSADNEKWVDVKLITRQCRSCNWRPPEMEDGR